ncbi:Ham1 nucleoside triphosphatase [Encephalitozoon intestinalis ATCC 50506]|uniref:Inosine triphosphate pyrophosphatase n=1 Tax=Encephalitozoon intestinalis (strain ATCC 50506) TaxID=876142 RepID=ITPA_ENCIT|nr:Ham1 nucleoside triphosphatase [Encephalitozoon intestinalis ATCC 50506]E0S6S0.1 RecName: Full=Inosine triphosphate pyrophosphatase; Short=ITPase; Short=Inosine triphosphatase; AltName: Full=Non-canonical purine NTP pyrophosphatase; AltName: Full=Non-standard purine NTP pyrophosphatase; AltName: Full=Nucleoside-triphosphate diphosphatase; AltName: Full=Nucleoside-triphosphate pyrophosphatase; Short=NTPase [Encephalitozoon intestinalis ATCC 50506]ADM11405.1 Ham1 nucleoside triphosphatase [Encep
MTTGKIYFATTNLKKLNEVKEFLKTDIDHMRISMTEIQGPSEKIVEHKLDQAAPFINPKDAVIVDDTSFSLEALGGFPGVYVKDFLEIGTRKIWEIVEKIGNKSATAVCSLGIAHYENGEIVKKVFSGKLKGSITEPEKDCKTEFGYIFIPDGFNGVLKNMPTDEKNRISHRGIASRSLAAYMASKGIIKTHGP